MVYRQEVPSVCLSFSVEWLILDEADKLFEDGERSFKDQVRTGQLFVLQMLGNIECRM